MLRNSRRKLLYREVESDACTGKCSSQQGGKVVGRECACELADFGVIEDALGAKERVNGGHAGSGECCIRWYEKQQGNKERKGPQA